MRAEAFGHTRQMAAPGGRARLARRGTAARLGWLAALVGLCFVGTTDARIIHNERSLYTNIIVAQGGSVLCMQFTIRQDQRNQSCFDRQRPKHMIFPYTRMMMASLLLDPNPKRILMLGLGGGTLPMALDEVLPDAHQDVIEIDPAVTRVARDFFGFAPSERVRVIAEDGRVFVKRAVQKGERYDLVMLDAFNGDYIPEHLMTREFLREVRSLLTEGGVLAANTFTTSTLYDHESVTYSAVYGEFFNLNPDPNGNRIVLASTGALPDQTVLAARARELGPKVEVYGVDVDELLQMFDKKVDWNTTARVLTDQYAPANLLQRR
jgi:spermidine synthase